MNDESSLSHSPSSNDWHNDALMAIELASDWAQQVISDTKCQVFLFGSSIYKNGEQFDSVKSDLDIVCLFPENSNTITRHSILTKLKNHKLDLELRMIPVLGRETCTEPGVSIVALTYEELLCNAHKSGVRRFWDKNYFYNLENKEIKIFTEAGNHYIPDEGRHAMEYIQKIRNDYLSFAANKTGGIKPFGGVDPLPKALMRIAAQLSQEVEAGEWYDTMFGLKLMRSETGRLRTNGGIFKVLADCIEVRSGAKGRLRALSADELLLLAEILLDMALGVGVEKSTIFQLHLIGMEYTLENVENVFSKLKRFIAGVKVSGHTQGSIILQLSAPESSIKTLEDLQNGNALGIILGATEAIIKRGSFEQKIPEGVKESRIAILTALIKTWRPYADLSPRGIEDEFLKFLNAAIENIPELKQANVWRDAEVGKHKFTLDFTISWRNVDGTYERMAIELKRATTAARLFDTLAKFSILGQKVVLVLVGGEALLEIVAPNLRNYSNINANVEIVAVPLLDRESDI